MVLFAALLLLNGYYRAQTDTISLKKQFWLFNPTPESLMRDEIGADRPDETESPYTIDAGHFMYEADVFRYNREVDDDASKKQYLFHQANLKFGLTSAFYFQILIQSYGIQTDQSISSGLQTRREGVGDVNLRLKRNLYGNDHENLAVGAMTYVMGGS